MRALVVHQAQLKACRRCQAVTGPVVVGQPVQSPIYLLGQAPGPHEGGRGRPFAHTAGTTLFRWFDSIGVGETQIRERIYMAAVLRCFPGKARSGGDRVPNKTEIRQCADWIAAEQRLLQPELLLAVGRLAIEQVAERKPKRLDEVIGEVRRGTFHGRELDWLALPHPSGVSTWHKTEPGRTLLARALSALAEHPAWRRTFPAS